MSESNGGQVLEEESNEVHIPPRHESSNEAASQSTVHELNLHDDLYDAELSDDEPQETGDNPTSPSVSSFKTESVDRIKRIQGVDHLSQDDLYDAELSDDASEENKVKHPNILKDELTIPSPGKAYKKKGNKKPVSKSHANKIPKTQQSRKSKCQAMQEIRSHSQRLLRDSPITLPYHKPKQHTLSEFLARRKLKVPVPLARSNGIQDLVKKIELIEEEIEEFYNSDSDIEEAENQVMPEPSSDTIKDACHVEESNKIDGDLPEIPPDVTALHLPDTSSCELAQGENIEDTIDGNRSEQVLNTLGDGSNDRGFINTGMKSAVENLTLQEIDNIEFEILEPACKVGVSSLIDRYIKHNEFKDMPEKDLNLSVIEKETNHDGKQNLVNKVIKVKLPGNVVEPISVPGLKLLRLKESLKKQMASKRQESRVKKMQDFQMLEENDILDMADNLPDEDDVFTDSETEEIDNSIQKIPNSDFIDAEAEESLISDNDLCSEKLDSDSDTESVIGPGKKMCLVLDSESSDDELGISDRSKSEPATYLNTASDNGTNSENSKFQNSSLKIADESLKSDYCDVQSKVDSEDWYPGSDAFMDKYMRNDSLCDPHVSEGTQAIMKELVGLCSGEFSSAPNVEESLDGTDIEDMASNLMSKKRKNLTLSDDEESVSSKHELDSQVIYDSDENEISNAPKDFLDLEAELSGSDVGDEEEEDDDEDLDTLQTREADLEDLNLEKVQSEIGKIYHKQILDEDTYKLNLYKEVYLEDGELHSERHRQRKFKWKDTFDEFGHANMSSDDENDNAEEPLWRRERYEREQWLIENAERLCVTQDYGEQPETPIDCIHSVGPAKKAAIKRNGSFLLRKTNNLCRIAELTKANSSYTLPKTNGNFIFKTDAQKLEKRSHSEQKPIIKRPKLCRSFHSLEDDHKHNSIFHYIHTE